MSRRSIRLLGVAKWMLLIVSILFAVAWTASSRHIVSVTAAIGPSQYSIAFGSGLWGFVKRQRLADSILDCSVERESHTYWWPIFETASRVTLAVPFWMSLAVTVPLAGLCLRLDRRQVLPGQCRCGYSLAGLAEGIACPECGAKA